MEIIVYLILTFSHSESKLSPTVHAIDQSSKVLLGPISCGQQIAREALWLVNLPPLNEPPSELRI